MLQEVCTKPEWLTEVRRDGKDDEAVTKVIICDENHVQDRNMCLKIKGLEIHSVAKYADFSL